MVEVFWLLYGRDSMKHLLISLCLGLIFSYFANCGKIHKVIEKTEIYERGGILVPVDLKKYFEECDFKVYDDGRCIDKIPNDIDWLEDNGRTPLAVAIDRGEPVIVKFLLNAGANPKVESKFGNWVDKTPIQLARERWMELLQDTSREEDFRKISEIVRLLEKALAEKRIDIVLNGKLI